jgi:hypothetical protein
VALPYMSTRYHFTRIAPSRLVRIERHEEKRQY